jgi:hypothetical protein
MMTRVLGMQYKEREGRARVFPFSYAGPTQIDIMWPCHQDKAVDEATKIINRAGGKVRKVLPIAGETVFFLDGEVDYSKLRPPR